MTLPLPRLVRNSLNSPTVFVTSSSPHTGHTQDLPQDPIGTSTHVAPGNGRDPARRRFHRLPCDVHTAHSTPRAAMPLRSGTHALRHSAVCPIRTWRPVPTYSARTRTSPSGSPLQPVFQPQAGNTLEFPRVVCHQHGILRERLRGDPEVVGADQAACGLEFGAQYGISFERCRA